MDLDFDRVLHIAPERAIGRWLKQRAGLYLSVDIRNAAAARMDVTRLALSDESITLIWCSHVLEHVQDDSSAIQEFARVLVPGGKAIVQVPIWRQATFEDPAVTSSTERLRSFYQADHVRLYGMDIVERFARSGFSVQVHRAQEFGPARLLMNGLSFASTNEVFVFSNAR